MTRSEIHCANWCAMTATCNSAVFNSTTMHCGLYREYQSASNSSSQQEQLILQRDVSTATTVAVESGTTDGTHESDMSTTKQTTKAATEIDDTSTVTNRITSKETKQVTSFTSTGKTTILTTEATTISSQQKNWTVLGADDCYLTTSSEYSGTIIYTVNGIPCQFWNTNTPHIKGFLPVGETSHDTNYCRESTNYDKSLVGAADCYLTTSTEYSGTISYTVNGIPCQYWNTNIPHTRSFNPIDTTANDTNYCRESTNAEGGPEMKLTNTYFVLSGDACGVDERLPVVPTGTKYHFLPSKFIGMVFTCDTLTPGTSIDHCPVSQCGSDDQWTTGYSVSCTGTFDI
ncbi:MST1 [Mytilus edulis]|uniref:MST1 n=1 Tax=Mytilus edulis TaxID=6550 RepID=A0A8S3V003_MYTED|nr:MST1 [Mytilus edulis]